MTQIEVVGFAPEHADGVAALARAEGWPTFADPDRAARLCQAPGAIGVVATARPSEADGETGELEVVGAGHLLTDGHHGYLTILMVAQAWRRRGIARRLTDECFARSGAVRIDLLSTDDAEPFYRSLLHQRLPGYRIYAHDPRVTA